MRAPFRRLLTEVWEEVIATDYANQRVNSERSLQAAVWSGLNDRLPPRTRRLFVEPPFTIDDHGTSRLVRPDLVVCNSRRVIAVIEVKYEPRKAPSIRKDLRTLQSLSEHGGELGIANDRYLGDGKAPASYRLSDKTIFVWVGVYRASGPDPEPIQFEVPEGLVGRFHSLHAVTRPSRAAKTFAF